jgi:hypothetical protein
LGIPALLAGALRAPWPIPAGVTVILLVFHCYVESFLIM